MSRRHDKGGMSYGQLWLLALGLPEMKYWLGITLALLAGTLMNFGGWVALAEGALLGIGFWFFAEYLLHRFLLHMRAPKPAFLAHLHRRIHWIHHQRPNEREFLFIPLWGTLPLFAVAMALGWWVGGLVTVFSAGLGFAAVLGIYETTHLAAHVTYHPRSRLGALMKRYHLLHHYKNEGYWFGVTHPVMDMVFGTWKPRDAVPKSRTARDLGIHVD
jgi:sterol desaturase/sphingolipid hydroxylase (fatty acid hydroxylase superfamily)